MQDKQGLTWSDGYISLTYSMASRSFSNCLLIRYESVTIGRLGQAPLCTS
ncbi:Orf30 [Lactococcus phage bIL309]|nr:Orf30 [Lactococcus phage bIL309]AAK08378.1 Orf30 [Lactococcus phage bIL309]